MRRPTIRTITARKDSGEQLNSALTFIAIFLACAVSFGSVLRHEIGPLVPGSIEFASP